MKYYLEDHATGSVRWIYEESGKGWRLAWSERNGHWAPLPFTARRRQPPWTYSSGVWFKELTREELFALVL